MYDNLDYSAFANLNLRTFETESAEPPSLLPQTPALLPSSEQANHEFLGEDICTLRRSTCRGIVSKLRYSKYNKGQKTFVCFECPPTSPAGQRECADSVWYGTEHTDGWTGACPDSSARTNG